MWNCFQATCRDRGGLLEGAPKPGRHVYLAYAWISFPVSEKFGVMNVRTPAIANGAHIHSSHGRKLPYRERVRSE